MAVLWCITVILLASLSNSAENMDNYHQFSHLNDSNSSQFCLYNSHQCSPWSYCDSSDGTCQCFQNNAKLFMCDASGNRYSIVSCYCLTLNERKNTTEVGLCIYNCNHFGKSVGSDYKPLPHSVLDLNKATCGLFNRTGSLCGQCKNGTYLRAYSYDMSCTNCVASWSNWIKYFMIAYLPLTFFYFVVLLFQINIPSSSIQGYVFFSQIVSSPFVVRLIFVYLKGNTNSSQLKFIKFLGSLFGMWNLDFFRALNLEICFQVSPLTVLSLDFFVAVYPLLLMFITYIITLAHDSNFGPVVMVLKPFKTVFSAYKSNWNVRTSTVDAFSTFMFLCNVKFLSICFDLLAPVQVCDTSNNHKCKWAVFYDATLPYLGSEHLPYVLFAFVVLIVFVIFPVLILLLYPFKICHKVLDALPRRWQIILHVFVDSFQGYYKDGTEPGTKDCRWFSAVPFIVRFIILGLYSSILLSSAIEFCTMTLALTAILIVTVDPYKTKVKELSSHLASFVLFLASLFVTAIEIPSLNIQRYLVIGGLIMLLQLMYTSALTIRWIISRRRFCFHYRKYCTLPTSTA